MRPQPDLLPDPDPTVTVTTTITCPNCGYTILTMDREMTGAEIQAGLDRKISDLQQTVERLTHKLEGRGDAL